MTPDLVTTEEASEILIVPAGAIAKWKHRGKITPVGLLRDRGVRGGQGAPLYRLDELRPLATAYHHRHDDE